MGFTVEVSFDTRKHKDISDFKYNLKQLCYSCGGAGGIFLHEFYNCKHKTTSYTCIFVCFFDKNEEFIIDSYYNPEFEYLFIEPNDTDNLSQEAKNCQLFIYKIKNLNNNILLETIYSSYPSKLIYASKRFLLKMKKEEANHYLNNILNNKHYLSNEEELIINTIKYKY